MGTEQELASYSSTCSPALNSAVLARPFFPFFFFCNFIYLFLAVLDLRCCAGFFSSCSKQGLLSSCGVRASHCSDFSCAAQVPGRRGFSIAGSRAQAPQLWHTGLAAPRAVGSSRTRDLNHGSCVSKRIPHHWATREAPFLSLCLSLNQNAVAKQMTFDSCVFPTRIILKVCYSETLLSTTCLS